MSRETNQNRKKAKRSAASQARAAARRAERMAGYRGKVSTIDPTGGTAEKQPPTLGTVGRIIGEI